MSPLRRKRKEKPSKEGSDAPSEAERPPYMYVRFMELTGLMDVTPISEEVRNGNLVIIDIGPLVQKGSDLKLQLKRAVDQLRAVCFSVDGDIGQLGNRYILLTPGSVKIFRETEGEPTTSQPSSSDST